jgi:hypothetical protein
MAAFIRIIRILNTSRLGTCPTCTRIAFLAATFSWSLPLIASIFGREGVLFILVAPVGLTLLWIAHVIMAARRSAHSNLPENLSRRLAMWTFAKSIISAAAISALPIAARADSGCGGWAGNSGCSPCPDYMRHCYRQDSNCMCYACRSCGDDCPNEATC